MKFDSKKPYGTITNHPYARYEQDGILFDLQYQPIDQNETNKTDKYDYLPVTTKKVESDFNSNQAKAFLKNILKDGQLARSVVFKECENNNQDWESVKSAFAELGVSVMRRNILYWKLKAE